MEMLFSAALGELTSRSISFLINKYWTPPALSQEESIQRLQRMLLRVCVTVEEAEGRCVTNRAMLRQLNMLREEMYRGYYVLDTFRCRAHKEGHAKDCEVNRSFALSKFNPAKRVCFSAIGTHGTKELEQMLDTVEAIVTGMEEFAVFLSNCPPMYRQPYSMYLFMERCMFGRQMEMEQVIDFLLQEEPPGDGNPGVLPIVGPGKIGKSTLVEHVCCNERVRNHFSQIIFFSEKEFSEEKPCTLRDGGVFKHQRRALDQERLLVVIELGGDVDEGGWRRLLSASRSCVPDSSKVVITSRSGKIAGLGTTRALNLNFLSREAYWYFFKVLAFGSSNPEEQPKLASIAKQIFEEYFDDQEIYKVFSGMFIDANNIAGIMRANVNARHWRRVLTCVRENGQKNQLPFSIGPSDIGMEGRLFYLRRIVETTQYCVVRNHDRVGSAHEEVPKITLQAVLSGNLTPQGKFDVVLCRSLLPPYHTYIHRCEIRESKCMLMRNKWCRKRKISS